MCGHVHVPTSMLLAGQLRLHSDVPQRAAVGVTDEARGERAQVPLHQCAVHAARQQPPLPALPVLHPLSRSADDVVAPRNRLRVGGTAQQSGSERASNM